MIYDVFAIGDINTIKDTAYSQRNLTDHWGEKSNMRICYDKTCKIS